MVTAPYSLDATFKSVNKINRFRHYKLCTVIPCPNPSTLHGKPIAVLVRHHRMVELGGYRIILSGVQESHGRRAEEPLVEIAGVKIGPNIAHINRDLPNGVRGIYKHLIDTLFSADGNELLHRDDNARHGGDVVDDREADLAPPGLGHIERGAELGDDGVRGRDGERQRHLDDGGPGAGDVGVDGLLDGAVRVVEHEHGVPAGEPPLGEAPRGVLQHDGGGGGGVVDEGDLGDVPGVDEARDGSPRAAEPRLEGVEVEVVGLGDEEALPPRLRVEEGGRAAPEAAVVDARHPGLVVLELRRICAAEITDLSRFAGSGAAPARCRSVPVPVPVLGRPAAAAAAASSSGRIDAIARRAAALGLVGWFGWIGLERWWRWRFGERREVNLRIGNGGFSRRESCRVRVRTAPAEARTGPVSVGPVALTSAARGRACCFNVWFRRCCLRGRGWARLGSDWGWRKRWALIAWEVEESKQRLTCAT